MQFSINGIMADKRDANPCFVKGTPIYLDDNHKRYEGAVVGGRAKFSRILIRKSNEN